MTIITKPRNTNRDRKGNVEMTIRRKKLSFEEKQFEADGWKGEKIFEAELVNVSNRYKDWNEDRVRWYLPDNVFALGKGWYYELIRKAGELPRCCEGFYTYGLRDFLAHFVFSNYPPPPNPMRTLPGLVTSCAFGDSESPETECHRMEFSEVPNIFNRDTNGYTQQGCKIVMKIWKRGKEND